MEINRIYFVVCSLLLLMKVNCLSQNSNECLSEILLCEESRIDAADSMTIGKNISISYSVKVVEWEGQTTTSNVRIFKNDQNLHFFSEQASMFNDSKDVLVVMPAQKVIVVSSSNKKKNNLKLNENFFAMHKDFLKNCDVVKCENKTPETKVLVLNAIPAKVNPAIKIKSITYEYNPVLKKIISIKTDYNSDYKMKQLTITYKDYIDNSTYKFESLSSYFLNKKGNLLDKYKDYEFVDNREEAEASNGKKGRNKH